MEIKNNMDLEELADRIIDGTRSLGTLACTILVGYAGYTFFQYGMEYDGPSEFVAPQLVSRWNNCIIISDYILLSSFKKLTIKQILSG